jgi:hypothetical protein
LKNQLFYLFILLALSLILCVAAATERQPAPAVEKVAVIVLLSFRVVIGDTFSLRTPSIFRLMNPSICQLIAHPATREWMSVAAASEKFHAKAGISKLENLSAAVRICAGVTRAHEKCSQEVYEIKKNLFFRAGNYY